MLGRIHRMKPDFAELAKDGFKAVDMHYHSRFSDTYTRVQKIIEKAEHMGCGVAITDHNAIGGAKRALQLKEDVLVIPGIETSSVEGPHILSYFPRFSDLQGFYEHCVKEHLDEDPYCRTSRSVKDIVRFTHEYGGIVSAAHPFAPAMMGLHKAISRKYVPSSILRDIDAIEVMTGVNMKGMTGKSMDWAELLGKSFTGGSDGHSLRELGNVVTYSKARTARAFIDSIKDKDNFVMGKETRIASRIPSVTMTTNRHLKYFRPFITSKARCVMHDSVYYHTRNMNLRLRLLAMKGAILVNAKAGGIPGRMARKGVEIVRKLKNGTEKEK